MGLKCKGTRIDQNPGADINTVQKVCWKGPGRKKSQTTRRRRKTSSEIPSEIPTVVRDIIYGWARGFVGVAMASVFKPQTFTQEAARG